MKVQVTSRLELNTDGVLERRGLGKSKAAAKVLASEVKRLSDPYVPFQQGTLKNTGKVVESSTGVAILYNQPYAHYQYHGEVMAGRAPKQYTGKPIDYHGAPQRGKEWDKRMMADRGKDVSSALARYIGGRAK